MSESSFRIVLTGAVRDGAGASAVSERLARLFKLDPKRAAVLLAGGERIIKRGLNREGAEKCRMALEQTGAVFRVEAEPASRMIELKMEELAPDSHPPPEPTELARCPQCSYLAGTASDDLAVKGECPACGIVLAKYLERLKANTSLPLTATAPGDPQASPGHGHLSGPARRPERQLGGRLQTGRGEKNSEARITFYQDTPNSEWSIYWRSSVIFSLLALIAVSFDTLIAPVFATRPDGRLPVLTFSWKFGLPFIPEGSVLAHQVHLVFIGAAILAVIFAMFYGYYIYKYQRGALLYYALFSGGGVLAGAFLGYLGMLVFRIIHGIVKKLDLDQLTSFRTACTVLCVIIFFMPYGSAALRKAYYPDHPVDQAGLTETRSSSKGSNVGHKLGERLQRARSDVGGDFPLAGTDQQFNYYRTVYVTPALEVTGDFDAALSAHLDAFLDSSSHRPRAEPIELMVFNAVCYRDQLAREGLISTITGVRLNAMAFEWGRNQGEQQPGQGRSMATIRREEFESHCPIRKPEDLADNAAKK